jgi:peptidoglycan hydrolase CwlO-like protein
MKTGFKKLFTCLCLVAILVTPMVSFAQVSDAERAQLEKELAALQAEIAQKEKELASQKQNSASLSKDVTVLTSQINKAKLEIQAKNKTLQQLGGQINQKDKTIQTLDTKRSRQEESLSQILRKKYQMDNSTLAEILLSKQTLSGFLGEVDNLQSINEGIQTSFGIIKKTKELTAAEKDALEQKKNQENDVKYQLENQKKTVETTQAEKNRMLSISKGQEKNYEAVIKDRQARAAQIRSRLFELRGQKGIAFGDAYKYAVEAAKATGVRPAFVLAIMTQESSLGKNVGQCNVGGKSKTWQESMPGPADIAAGKSRRDDESAFLRITKKLGLNPDTTPVSCPLASGGWGGAMGPSQFIPTTWEGLESSIMKAANSSTANPWNPEHAVIATSIYVGRLGAKAQTYTAERNAACSYYSGHACGGSNEFYGNSVMNIAAKLQKDIDFLKDN